MTWVSTGASKYAGWGEGGGGGGGGGGERGIPLLNDL